LEAISSIRGSVWRCLALSVRDRGDRADHDVRADEAFDLHE
jgi:hypothetical protein